MSHLTPRSSSGARRVRYRPIYRQQGFTLLEMLVAFIFVALLAGGIVLSLSTALRVWKLTSEEQEVNQEARAIMDLLSRDIRGSYLGIMRDAGFFLGGEQSEPTSSSTGSTSSLLAQLRPASVPVDPLFFTTDSSSAGEASLLPGAVLQDWNQEQEPPLSDIMAVRWEWREGTSGPGAEREGLYRTSAVINSPEPESQISELTGEEYGQVSTELISQAVKKLQFQFYDGEQWVTSWDSRDQQNKVPQAVAIELVLYDPEDLATRQAYGVSNKRSGRENIFRSVVTIATR